MLDWRFRRHSRLLSNSTQCVWGLAETFAFKADIHNDIFVRKPFLNSSDVLSKIRYESFPDLVKIEAQPNSYTEILPDRTKATRRMHFSFVTVALHKL